MRKKPTKTYMTWASMRNRCNNANAPNYRHYGGRGIRICDRWSAYANFLADMGEKPDGRSIERIDVNGNYTPDNCRWATQSEQLRNMRITRRVTIEGRQYVAADLADIAGIKTDAIVVRARNGLSYAEVISPDRIHDITGFSLGGVANGRRQQAKTHCPSGHEFDLTNTRITPQGWRRCRACSRIKMRQATAAKRALRQGV